MNNDEQIKLDECALNAAAWKFVESYTGVIGQHMPGRLFHNCKSLLRESISTYIEEHGKSK